MQFIDRTSDFPLRHRTSQELLACATIRGDELRFTNEVMTMKRMTVLMMMGLLGVFTLFQIGESQQAPALPQAPGAPAPAAGGGGRGQGGGGRGAQQAAPVPAILENYKPVTAERLK